jgi:hypothetical protein
MLDWLRYLTIGHASIPQNPANHSLCVPQKPTTQIYNSLTPLLQQERDVSDNYRLEFGIVLWGDLLLEVSAP